MDACHGPMRTKGMPCLCGAHARCAAADAPAKGDPEATVGALIRPDDKRVTNAFHVSVEPRPVEVSEAACTGPGMSPSRQYSEVACIAKNPDYAN